MKPTETPWLSIEIVNDKNLKIVHCPKGIPATLWFGACSKMAYDTRSTPIQDRFQPDEIQKIGVNCGLACIVHPAALLGHVPKKGCEFPGNHIDKTAQLNL